MNVETNTERRDAFHRNRGWIAPARASRYPALGRLVFLGFLLSVLAGCGDSNGPFVDENTPMRRESFPRWNPFERPVQAGEKRGAKAPLPEGRIHSGRVSRRRR